MPSGRKETMEGTRGSPWASFITRTVPCSFTATTLKVVPRSMPWWVGGWVGGWMGRRALCSSRQVGTQLQTKRGKGVCTYRRR